MIAVQAIMPQQHKSQSHGVPSNQWQYNLDFKPEFDRATNISNMLNFSFPHLLKPFATWNCKNPNVP